MQRCNERLSWVGRLPVRTKRSLPFSFRLTHPDCGPPPGDHMKRSWPERECMRGAG